MKAADRLSQQLGANITESMGVARQGGNAFPPPGLVHGGPDKYQGAARIKDALAVEVGRIVPDPNQPRRDFDPDALADLAASLKARGQLQPIRVRWDEGTGKWSIISGERRYRAALLAGLPTLMCVEAKGPLSADDILEDQLVENCVRADLTETERARAFATLIDRRGWSHRQLAEMLHISHQSVGRVLNCLKLTEDLQQQVDTGELPLSVASEVSRIEDPEAQRDVVRQIKAENLTRDDALEAARQASGRSTRGAKGRGASKARKLTAKTIRTAAGKVEVTLRKGEGLGAIHATLAEALGKVEVEMQGRGEAAA